MPSVAALIEQMIVDPEKTITPRQLELIALYASGYQLDEIATMKFLSYSTVKNHLTTARERVGAKTLTHLCVVLVDHGLIIQNGRGYKPVQAEGIVAE